MSETVGMERLVWALERAPFGGLDDDVAMLSPAERARFEAAAPDARGGFLAGRVLLRRLAAAQLGIDPERVPIRAVCPDCGGPHGRPFVEGSQLRLSLSRCAGAVAAAVAWGCDVGIDVETLGHAETARDAIREVAGGGPSHWTRVEATLKADGRGLRVDPRRVRIAGLTARVLDRPTRYRIVEPDVGAALQLSIAVADPP